MEFAEYKFRMSLCSELATRVSGSSFRRINLSTCPHMYENIRRFPKRVAINNMAATDQNSNAVLSGLARHINCLGEENKMARRKALENIRKESSGRRPPLETSELKPVLNELLKPLLKEFSDPVEKCREVALDILKSFHSQVSSPEDYLPYVIPVLVQRLGQQDLVEPSEELRLQMVEFLLQILERSGKNIALYLDDLIKILQRTLIDPFADVKKKSCQCSSTLAKAIPEYFVQQSESLIKPLCMSISHQHSKVRSIVVYTIGKVFSALPHFKYMKCKWYGTGRGGSVVAATPCSTYAGSISSPGQTKDIFSSTIRRIWRAITVTPASALHWLKFYVHPRNMLIPLHILLV